MNKKEVIEDLISNIEEFKNDLPKQSDPYLRGYNKGWIQGLSYAYGLIKRVPKKELMINGDKN